MLMMDIGCMFVLVLYAGMPVWMRVLANECWFVNVVVVAVIVAMGVLMFDGAMHMVVRVTLGEVKKDGGTEGDRSKAGRGARMPVAEQPGDASADERTDGKN